MITVKLTPHKEIKKLKWREGLTVGDILNESKWTASSISVFVNNVPADSEKELADGDEVVLVPIVGGG